MKFQRGGSFRVSGYLAIALLALAGGEALALRHYMHENSVLKLRILGTSLTTQIHGSDDALVTHAFPKEREVCDSFDTICYIKI